ncbi:MAG: hypothetical protein F6K40_02700 [Okeania sp. SIO3I5]|uniref:hypothetical protein n=1 Tax=Okeania sp. SIO3I5 TaxID=2607805 RepID=UPI0013B931B1|nr:hypothetical protein [Okeania sp. SIO3I5]NEQ35271.1 hypothetical protein [Okeania sp. SIO3I5]
MKLLKKLSTGKYRKWLITLLTIIILSVTATPAFAFVSTETTENSLTELNQAFDQAWAEKPTEDRKSHLYGVCDSDKTSVLQQSCLDELETFLKFKKKSIVDACYQPGVNMKICLGLANTEQLDKWIKQLHYSNSLRN